MILTTIHGTDYSYRSQVKDRMDELAKLNAELGRSDGRVTEQNMLREWYNKTAPPPPDPKPYYLYWRTATGGKGYRAFKTRKAQTNFMVRHDDDYAFTAYN